MQITVKEAKNGDQVLPGQALIAPGDKQMKVVRVGTHYTVSCLDGEKVSGHKPSVDVLFNSVADAAGPNAIGVILTGRAVTEPLDCLRCVKKELIL